MAHPQCRIEALGLQANPDVTREGGQTLLICISKCERVAVVRTQGTRISQYFDMRIQAHANRHLDKMSEIERTELVELSAVLDEYAPVLPLSRHASPAVAVAVVPQPIAEQSSSESAADPSLAATVHSVVHSAPRAVDAEYDESIECVDAEEISEAAVEIPTHASPDPLFSDTPDFREVSVSPGRYVFATVSTTRSMFKLALPTPFSMMEEAGIQERTSTSLPSLAHTSRKKSNYPPSLFSLESLSTLLHAGHPIRCSTLPRRDLSKR